MGRFIFTLEVKALKKTALITGATGGIGREITLALWKNGYEVIINYNKNEKMAKELAGITGGKAVKADVSELSEVERMFAEAGDVDVLVNNAGIALPQMPFDSVSPDEARKVFDINFFGVFNCCKAVAPIFIHKKQGKIINISSVWGNVGASCEAVYSASKSAITGFTKSLAKELGPSGITVNQISPGFIKTKMNEHLAQDAVEEIENEIPLGRIGTPEDVAKAVLFLADNDYITGTDIVIDGVWTI
ncbi:MAG: SDR family oxidoreductase [Clostridia bacterium]|nr:SDR family oxidoreductase [Clostridia bacterium]